MSRQWMRERSARRPLRPVRLVGRRTFGLGTLAAGAALVTQKIRPLLAATTRPAEPRLIFAHYMVCCPAQGDGAPVADFASEIRQAQSRGIDGFALNCGSWFEEPRYRRTATKLFNAATQLGSGFKLFFSADDLSGDVVVAMVSEFYDHPNMLRVGGKPMLSTFDGDPDWAKSFLVPLSREHKPVTFVPFFFPDTQSKVFSTRNIAQLIDDNDYVDGFFYFGAAGTGETISRSSTKIGEAWQRAGKLYMAPVTPYYRGLRRNYRVFETHGFESMAQEWEAAIALGAQWVEIVTWNDWQESTYVTDFGAPSSNRVGDGYWGQVLSHTAYLAASEYYIRWFKTGIRRIDRDDLYWFYRLSPRSRPGRSDPQDKESGFPKGVENLEDRVFVTAFLTAPARIRIETGDRVREFDVADGVHHLGTDFMPGPQKFSALRNGRTILAGEGAFPITEDNWANFNYLTGQARPA